MRERLLEEEMHDIDYFIDVEYPSTYRMDKIYKVSKKIMDKVDENDRRKKTIKNPVPKEVEKDNDEFVPNIMGTIIPRVSTHIKFTDNPMEVL